MNPIIPQNDHKSRRLIVADVGENPNIFISLYRHVCNSAQVTSFTWYCTAFQLLSMSPLVRMMPFSSTWAFFSLFSFSTLTFKRLRRTMAALPAFNKHVFLFVHTNRLCKAEQGKEQVGELFFSTFNDLGDLGLVGVKFKRREEAQGAQVKGHNWWNALLDKKQCKDELIPRKNAQSLTSKRTEGTVPGRAKKRKAEFHLHRGR